MFKLFSHPYVRLMRLDRPTGIWLLLWPCWWSVALASHDMPSARLLALFFAGAVAMRSAGCIINDIVDRKIDAQVERTRSRPLASGEISLQEAVILLVLLLFVALDIAIEMKPIVLKLAAVSLIFVAAYPFMKRITWWPQAFLGLTFNFGALIGWAAQTGTIGLPAMLLYAGGVFWTLGYDTIYAHQDKQDDLLIGVKSTALLLGAKNQQWIGLFYTGAICLWVLAGIRNHNAAVFFIGQAAIAIHFIWQVRQVKFDSSESCLYIFRSNTILGWIFFGAVCVDNLWVIIRQL